jgi:hypothetical protein
MQVVADEARPESAGPGFLETGRGCGQVDRLGHEPLFRMGDRDEAPPERVSQRVGYWGRASGSAGRVSVALASTSSSQLVIVAVYSGLIAAMDRPPSRVG